MPSRRTVMRQRAAASLALDLQRLVPGIDALAAARTALGALRLPYSAEHQLRLLGLAARIQDRRERRADYGFPVLERALVVIFGIKLRARTQPTKQRAQIGALGLRRR